MKALSKIARRAVPRFLRAGDYEQTDEGLIVGGGIRVRGKYTDWVNGGDMRENYNLIVAEGILHILNVALDVDGTAKPSAYYLAPFSANATLASSWTEEDLVDTGVEIVSTSEGWAGANRLEWDASQGAAAGAISNSSNRASYTIVSTGTVSIRGAGLMTSQARGAHTGTLISAVKFSAAREVNNTDVWQLAYEVELADS